MVGSLERITIDLAGNKHDLRTCEMSASPLDCRKALSTSLTFDGVKRLQK